MWGEEDAVTKGVTYDNREEKTRVREHWEHPDKVLEPIGTFSKADTTNPKDLLGAKKVSITKLPPVAIIHASHAMMDGARKYGAMNWRAKKVQAEIYIDATLRHIHSWNEREENASDSGVHHLGHAMACLAILLDAQETGNLIDDRPTSDGTFQKVLSRLNEQITNKSSDRSSK